MGVIDIVANNLLVSSVIILSCAAVLFSMVRTANRMWTDSRLFSERINSIVYAPLLTVSFVMGSSFLWVGFLNLGTDPISPQAWMLVLAVVSTAIFGVYTTWYRAEATQRRTEMHPGLAPA